MTVFSARQKIDTLGNPDSYCFPLALDAMLKGAELPAEYYELFSAEYADVNGSFNDCVSFLLKDFFGIEPRPATEVAAVAKYNAFGASEQSYCPDAPYDYTGKDLDWQEKGVTLSQLRMRDILKNARNNRCHVLFTNPSTRGEHVSGLDMIDPGAYPASALYVVRDYVEVMNDKLYYSGQLTGMEVVDGTAPADEYSPLPELSRPVFPNGSSSWELIILPPEPNK